MLYSLVCVACFFIKYVGVSFKIAFKSVPLFKKTSGIASKVEVVEKHIKRLKPIQKS